MKPGRRDTSRRITPGLLDFYIKRAHALRDQAYVEAMHALWALLKKFVAML